MTAFVHRGTFTIARDLTRLRSGEGSPQMTVAESTPKVETKSSQSPRGANEDVRAWVEQCVQLCQPDTVHWCDGSERERQSLIARGVDEGVLIELNQQKLPG